MNKGLALGKLKRKREAKAAMKKARELDPSLGERDGKL
jgi:hypothetical protein